MASPPDPHRERYEQWVGRYAPELYSFAYRLVGSHQMAEDLVQETFTEAWRCVAQQREPGAERAWLFQILRFRCAHQVRRSMRDADVVRLPDEADEHPATHEDVLARMSDRESVQRGLEGLSPEVRRTFLMVFMEDLTCRETAAELKIPLGTVLSRLDSARRTLRQVMTRDDGAENGERPRDSAFRRPPRNSGDLGREEVRSP